MADETMTRVCAICSLSLREGEVVAVQQGYTKLIHISSAMNDGLFTETNRNINHVIHTLCRKKYTHPTHLAKATRNVNLSSASQSPPESMTLRSSRDEFNMKRDCLFCGQEAKKGEQSKKHEKYRKKNCDVMCLELRGCNY